MNSGGDDDDTDTVIEFMAAAGTSLPVLLDEDQEQYYGYSFVERGFAAAPFPLQVVIDRQGTITYLSSEYDVEPLREAIRAALDAE